MDGCSSHSGRRTFITRATRKVSQVGGSLRDVQELAGHTSLAMTQRYIEGDTNAKRKLVARICGYGCARATRLHTTVGLSLGSASRERATPAEAARTDLWIASHQAEVAEPPGGARVAKLIRFDIDGTLEVGDPPGTITMEMVRRAQALGYLIGSCSDRTVSHQRRLWMDHAISVAFTVLKHQLDLVKAAFTAKQYSHIDDTHMDRYSAERAGCAFFYPNTSVHHRWLPA
jgi:hypothetical protein